jgi:hypothetical protein
MQDWCGQCSASAKPITWHSVFLLPNFLPDTSDTQTGGLSDEIAHFLKNSRFNAKGI